LNLLAVSNFIEDSVVDNYEIGIVKGMRLSLIAKIAPVLHKKYSEIIYFWRVSLTIKQLF